MCTLITSKGTDIDENIANQIMLPVQVHRNRGILTSLLIPDHTCWKATSVQLIMARRQS
jgi:hypothetical protein